MSCEHAVKPLCETLMVSRNGYYDWLGGRESLHAQRDRSPGELIQKAYGQSRDVW